MVDPGRPVAHRWRFSQQVWQQLRKSMPMKSMPDNRTLAASESEAQPVFTSANREPAPQNWDSLLSPQLLQG